MGEILNSVLENLLWAVIVFILISFQKLFFTIIPNRRLWNIKNIQNVSVVASASMEEDTGQYIRKATGVGQLRALAAVINSLNLAYKNMNINDILLSSEHLGTRIEEDLILLGGPKNNKVTRKCMDRLLEIRKVIDQERDIITWYPQTENKIPSEPKMYQAITKDKKVIQDYGVIIRVQNPFSITGSQLCIFSGGHTHGTIAAAQYFTQSLKKNIFRKNIPPNYICLVKCDIIDDEPCNIQLVNQWGAKYFNGE